MILVAGKTGGGFQGREVKTKSTKKKYLGRDKDDGDSEEDDTAAQSVSTDTVFMSRADIADELRRQSALVDCSPEFTDAVASHLYRYVLELCKFVINCTATAFVLPSCFCGVTSSPLASRTDGLTSCT